MKHSIFFIIFLLVYIHLTAQVNSENRLYLAPGINIGYTFSAKFNVGLNFDIAFMKKDKYQSRYGISLGYNLIGVRDRLHRQRTFNLMYQNDIVDIKFGYSSIRVGWGYSNNNQCKIRGLAADVSVYYPNLEGPHIGYKLFLFDRYSWRWFDYHYHTIYAGYEYNFLKR